MLKWLKNLFKKENTTAVAVLGWRIKYVDSSTIINGYWIFWESDLGRRWITTTNIPELFSKQDLPGYGEASLWTSIGRLPTGVQILEVKNETV